MWDVGLQAQCRWWSYNSSRGSEVLEAEHVGAWGGLRGGSRVGWREGGKAELRGGASMALEAQLPSNSQGQLCTGVKSGSWKGLVQCQVEGQTLVAKDLA